MPFLEEIVTRYSFLILAILTALFLILFFWNILLHLRIGSMRKKSEEFFAGGKVGNLEEFLASQNKTIKILDRDIQELFSISNKINTLAQKGLYKVGMIRFNPFKDVGGDQSFAIALLNGKNNGLTISSLYTREGARVYSKNIVNGESEKYPLTEEEKKAIEIATNGKNKYAQPNN